MRGHFRIQSVFKYTLEPNNFSSLWKEASVGHQPTHLESYLCSSVCNAGGSHYSSVDSESRFTVFLGRILWKMRFASRENIIASLTSLARSDKGDILRSLRVLQF